jgi:hypothetical protein
MVEHLSTPIAASALESIARLENSLAALYAANTENKLVAVQLVLNFLSLLQHAHPTTASSSSGGAPSSAQEKSERIMQFLEQAHDYLGKRDACHEMVWERVHGKVSHLLHLSGWLVPKNRYGALQSKYQDVSRGSETVF